jgi:hypothetical protein
VLQRAIKKGEDVMSFDTEIIKECMSDVRLQSLFGIQEKLLKTQDNL